MKATSGRRRATSAEVKIWGLAAETERSACTAAGEKKKDEDEVEKQAVKGSRRRQEDGRSSDR